MMLTIIAADIVWWWLVMQAIGLAGMPLTTFLFRALPDKGYALGKSVGLLSMSYLAWLVAMFGLASYGVLLLMVMALCVFVVGVVCHYMCGVHANLPISLHQQWRAIKAFVQHNWLLIVSYEVLFVVALLFEAWLRAHQPNLWGTERPMDYAFFNALQQSTTFPPHDPWLAGYSLNYYYFGYLMMASVALLSGLHPSIGFNLSLALTFALTAVSSAAVLINAIRLSSRILSHTPHTGMARIGRYIGRGAVALLGVVLILFAGNQAGALQVLLGDHRVVALDGEQLFAALRERLSDTSASANKTMTLPSAVHTHDGDFGTFTTLEHTDRLADFNWWWPSRALWDEHPEALPGSSFTSVRVYNITEFPFFSFWLGDMHPHVMSLPFCVVAMALALNVLARGFVPLSTIATTYSSRAQWGDTVMTGLILGSLYAINSWDVPTYVLLYTGALVVVGARTGGGVAYIPWGTLIKQLITVAIAMVVLFLPFYLTFHSFAGAGSQPLTTTPILATITKIVAPLNCSRSGIYPFLSISGLFFVPLVAFTYLQPHAMRVVAWLAPIMLLVGVMIDFPLLMLAGVGLFALLLTVQTQSIGTAFVLLLFAMGCAIIVGTDIMFIRDVFNNRMNTIFKFYYHVWLLWGIGASYAVWWLVTHALTAHMFRRMVVGAVMLLFVGLLTGAMIYPALTLRDMYRNGKMIGLQGKTPREEHPDEANAIAWLREHHQPDSNILEMVAPGGGSYNPQGYGGVSASTGLPTVLGWVGHEQQWRGGHPTAKDEINPRQQDVERIYRTENSAEALTLLRTYNVRYVFVGNLERQTYSDTSLNKFEQIATPVFQSGMVTIYEVQ